MQCPHYIDDKSSRCIADDRLYAPSTFQIREYCSTDEHRKCPFYVMCIAGLSFDSGEAFAP